MATSTLPKSVTKAALSSLVCESTNLNLTQSKALTDLLLGEYTITPKQPADPTSIPLEVGQVWVHQSTQDSLRITDTEQGPIHVKDDPVTAWGPLFVQWQDTANPDNSGTAAVSLWYANMLPADSPSDPQETATTIPNEAEEEGP